MPTATQIADVAVGACLVAAGAVAWARRPSSRVGLLLGLTAATWFAGSVIDVALYLHRGPLVHLHLAYPTGRLRGWPSRITVAVAYVTAAVYSWARNDWVTIAVAGLVAATAASVFIPTLGPTRRALLPALGAALAFAGVLAFSAIARLAGWDIAEGVLWVYFAVVAVVAVVLVVDLLRGRWAEAIVTGLVVDLGGHTGTGGLQNALGRAIGDRTLVVGYWMPREQHYADDAGRTVEVERPAPGRSVTPIDDDGEPLAVLVHDDAVLVNRDHIEAVAAAARLAVSNTRLQDEAEARIEELAASRRRIVAAADIQRARLERELREGTQTRLDGVADLLDRSIGLAPTSLAGEIAKLDDELRMATAEVDELAKGIHPRALVDGGLAAALPALGARAGLPVHVDVDSGRLPPSIEAALYFVCSEAVTNAAKHAQAANVSIVVSRQTAQIVAEISDDGVGGADPGRGSGLRGLADRVETVGGTLAIDSPPGGGTRIQAAIPLDDDRGSR
jgi:signal transduction histidine kinase